MKNNAYGREASFQTATNEPILAYAPGSSERAQLEVALEEQASCCIDIPLVIGGRKRMTPVTSDVTCPHDYRHVLGRLSRGDPAHAQEAVAAAHEAHKSWSRWTLYERSMVFL